jgi:hypothetical protein
MMTRHTSALGHELPNNVAATKLRRPYCGDHMSRRPYCGDPMSRRPNCGDHMSRRPNVAATKLRRPNVAATILRRPNVPATKCPGDQMPGDQIAATKLRRPNVGLPGKPCGLHLDFNKIFNEHVISLMDVTRSSHRCLVPRRFPGIAFAEQTW